MTLVNGRPFLEYQIRWLRAGGVNSVVLCVGYLSSQIKSHFRGGENYGVRVHYSMESEPLGTAGALRQARSLLQERFVLLNGDTLCLVDLQALYRAHREACADVTMCVADMPRGAEYGQVETDNSKVTSFVPRETEDSDHGRTRYLDAGCYLLERGVLSAIPEGTPSSLNQHLFPSLLHNGASIAVFPCAAFWDIGTPERYKRFQSILSQMRDVLS